MKLFYLRSTKTIPILALIFLAGIQPAYAQDPSPTSYISARIGIKTDGTPPWEDHATSGVHDPGDDIDGNNKIVRTMDIVTYDVNVSVNTASAENLIVTATLPVTGDQVWAVESPAFQTQMDTLCKGPAAWSLSPDGTIFTCDLGTQTPITLTFPLNAYVNLKSLNGDTFTATVAAAADNGAPNADPNECKNHLPKGCSEESEEVTVSANFSMETIKKGHRLALGDSIEVANTEPGYTMRYYIFMKYGADGDARGSTLPDKLSIGTLSDAFKIWDYSAEPTRTALTNQITLDSCDNVHYGQLLYAHNPNQNQMRYSVTAQTWNCTQPGGPGTPIEITISDIDLERKPPYLRRDNFYDLE